MSIVKTYCIRVPSEIQELRSTLARMLVQRRSILPLSVYAESDGITGIDGPMCQKTRSPKDLSMVIRTIGITNDCLVVVGEISGSTARVDDERGRLQLSVILSEP